VSKEKFAITVDETFLETSLPPGVRVLQRETDEEGTMHLIVESSKDLRWELPLPGVIELEPL
jgi:hypothetical protein